MSKLGFKPDNDRESIESKIDRMNSRIFEFMNNSLMNYTDSECATPVRGSVQRRTLDDTEILFNDKLMLNEDNEELFYLYNQVCMKLEDFRSDSMRGQDLNDFEFSEIRSSWGDTYRKSEFEAKEVGLRDLYVLVNQIQEVIHSVEIGEGFTGTIKFAGINLNLQIYGIEISQKEKCSDQFTGSAQELRAKINGLEEHIVELKKKLSIPNEVINRFCGNIEKEMMNSYYESHSETSEKNLTPIKSADPKASKSWALLQVNYQNLKNHHKKFEAISNNLQWQSVEVQLARSQLQTKLQNATEKEVELSLRQKDIEKLQSDYTDKVKKIEQTKRNLCDESTRIERYKRKLEKMKSVLKAQILNLNKLPVPTEAKRPNSAPRVNEASPTLKRINSNSSMNSENLESEIEETQNEIILLEQSQKIKPEEVKSVKLSHLYTKLSNLKTQKAIERSTATSDSMQNMISSVSKSNERLPFSKRFSFSSGEGSRKTTPIKIAVISPVETSEVSKPPVYRRNGRTTSEIINVSNSLSPKCGLREERLLEREAEVEKKEKQLQSYWMKHPEHKDFVTLLQNEIYKLKKMQGEYDRKLVVLQEKIKQNEEVKKGDVKIGVREESAHLEKIKELYKLMEDLLL